MADAKISALTSSGAAQLTDVIPIARAGANYGLTVTNLLSANLAASFGALAATGGLTVTGAGSAISGGRLSISGNGELFATRWAYTTTRMAATEIFYLGASDSATPDAVFSNQAGVAIATIKNSLGMAIAQNIATPAGGTAALGLSMGSSAILWCWGSGAPTLSAAQGSVYTRTDGAANTRLYVNNNGSTGWAAVTSA